MNLDVITAKKHRANIAHRACQGDADAQLEYATILEAEGKADWAEFFRAKANGEPAFSLEVYQAKKAKLVA